jgi:hypothetical protein
MGMGDVEIVVTPDESDFSDKRAFLETRYGSSWSFENDLGSRTKRRN